MSDREPHICDQVLDLVREFEADGYDAKTIVQALVSAASVVAVEGMGTLGWIDELANVIRCAVFMDSHPGGLDVEMTDAPPGARH